MYPTNPEKEKACTKREKKNQALKRRIVISTPRAHISGTKKQHNTPLEFNKYTASCRPKQRTKKKTSDFFKKKKERKKLTTR
jgi:hypothetical protein